MELPIKLLRPTFDAQTKQDLMDVLDSGWASFGPKVTEFEEAWAKRVGAKYAVATNSATSALDLAIKAAGITEGELITPAFTFTSDAHVALWNGLTPVFADIDPDTFCIDPAKLPLSKDTQVIIAVDSHGRMADVEGIRLISRDPFFDEDGTQYNLKPLLIEDAAHAIHEPGEPRGDVVVYSFQAVKYMPIFDGGMITTDDEEYYKKLRKLTWLGIEQNTFERAAGGKYSWDYDIVEPNGIKAYMTNIQAVIGLGQLRRLDALLEKRQRIQARYNESFHGKPWFKEPLYSRTVQYYTPKWKDRDGLNQFLGENGIHTGMHFKPLHHLTVWKKYATDLPNTEAVFKDILSLPVHDALTDEEQRHIIEKVHEYYQTT
jgi:perosamine synthetase